jgi:outer membrane immunogenic protein
MKIFSTGGGSVAAPWRHAMRLLVCGLMFVGVASPAFAGDLSDFGWLRGSAQPTADPPNYAHWSGFYGGAQVGEDFHGVDLSKSVQPLITNIQGQDGQLTQIPLQSMANLPVTNTKGPSFGGFAGYNYQIDEFVFGVELNFNHSSMSATGVDNETRTYDIFVPSTSSTLWRTTANATTMASAQLDDYGTFRLRGGWAFGNFLPYLFGGLSVAQVDASRSVTVTYTAVDITPQTLSGTPPTLQPTHFENRGPITYTESDISHGKYVIGFDVGMGVEYALTKHLFLRAEFEYLQLSSVNDIRLNTTSGRVGAGVRF